jgi:peroxiredoxin
MMDARISFSKSFEVRVLLWAFAILLAGCGGSHDENGSIKVAIGKSAPEFTLKSFDGSTVSSGSLAGKVVVLAFWATWCEPCREEIADFKQIEASSKAKVITVALDEGGWKTVKPFVDRYDINYTVLLGNQEVFSQFGGLAIPYTLVLDHKQVVVNIFRGPFTRKNLEEDLKRIEGN